MNRPPILLRLLVIAAMTLSFGESVWASTCASMSMTAAAGAAASDGAMPDMPGMPASGEQQEGDGDPACPLGSAAVAQGCLAAASLPATSTAAPAPGDERAADLDLVAAADELIYGAPPFHPPRA